MEVFQHIFFQTTFHYHFQDKKVFLDTASIMRVKITYESVKEDVLKDIYSKYSKNCPSHWIVERLNYLLLNSKTADLILYKMDIFFHFFRLMHYVGEPLLSKPRMKANVSISKYFLKPLKVLKSSGIKTYFHAKRQEIFKRVAHFSFLNLIPFIK